ncbi:MAG: SigB/SigF/SigG family RNA polymerase sigma factor [Actinomycetota bacterium]|nr:SigB/SigF/SigG family RNA polymerase sigma factor [Actinomycetota bacterium]
MNAQRLSGYEHLAPLFRELAALPPADPGRAGPRARLVTGYLPLAEHVARRFTHRGVPKEDLEQVATVGLIHAVDRFEPERGIDFLSYAVPTIMGEVRRYFRDTAWSVRVPRRLKDLHRGVATAGDELTQRLGRAPTPSEIGRHLGVSTEDVYEGLEAGQVYRSVPLDDVLPAEAGPLHAEDSALAEVEIQETLRPLIRCLPERERCILALRFVRNMTQTQIAERLGISQMHVSRLLSRTLVTLRESLDEE